LSPYAFAFRRATPSRAPGLGVFRVLHGVGRMFDLVIFDVTVGNRGCQDMRFEAKYDTDTRRCRVSDYG